MKKFFLILFVFNCFLPFFSKLANAQQVELEECQQYYQFGEVKVNLNTKKPSYNRGEKVELFGTVVNDNSFPLLNITIYAHLKRINEETFLENGHFLIDRFVLAQGLNFLPKETKSLSNAFEIKSNYPAGRYQLQYYVFSKDGFYYSGRPFLEEDFAGVTNFSLQNALTPSVYFDLNSLTLNGQPQMVRESIPIFDSGTNPLVEVDLKDLRPQRSDLSLVFKWYRWDDSFEENLVKTGNFFLSANQPPIFQIPFDLTEPGAYVLLLELNEPQRSLFKFRIARRGEKADRLRMNDLGITNYPVDPQKDRAFVCFHSPAEENSPRTRVTLSLLDRQNRVLETKTIEDSFSGEVMAISVPLGKLIDSLNFSIQADFEDLENPSRSRTLKYDFNCQLFENSLGSLSTDYQNGKLILGSANACGGQMADSYAERIVIYKDGQIEKEEYNVKPIPSEIDISDLAYGNYKLLVKSGSLEKEMEFSVREEKGPLGVEPRVKKSHWWLMGFILIGVACLVIVIWKRKIVRGSTSIEVEPPKGRKGP